MSNTKKSNSDKRKMDKTLFNSPNCNEVFDNLFTNVTYSVYLLNKENKFVRVNKYAKKMYGYETDYFIGKTPEFLSAPGKNDFKKIEEYHRLAFEGKPQKFKFWAKRKNGEIFLKEVRLHLAKFSNQEILIATGEDLSEKQKLEESIKISEERYRTIVENTDNLIIIIQDGKIVYINSQIKNYLDLEVEEILNKPFTDFVLEKDRENFYKLYSKRINGDVDNLPTEYDIQLLAKGGELKYFNIRPVVINWGKGKAIMEILKDITDTIKEKKRSKLLNKIIENSNNILFESEIAPNNECKFVTDNISSTLGYSPDEFYSKKLKLENIIFSEDVDKFTSTINQFNEPGSNNFSIVLRLVKKNGQIIFANFSGTIEIDEITNKKKLHGIISDITETHLLNQEIKEHKKNYELVINNIHEAIIISQNFQIRFVNDSMVELSEYSKEELLGMNLEKIIHPEDMPIVKDRYIRRLNKEKNVPVNYDMRLITKNNITKWVVVNPVIIEWKNKPAIITFLRDVTFEKESYQKLKESEYYYRTITENINEALTIIDKNFKLIYYNKSFMDLIDAETDVQVENLDIFTLIDNEFVESIKKNFNFDIIIRKTHLTIEIKIRTLKNNEKWILLKSRIIDWKGEKALLTITSDITEQKLAELKARENEQILDTLLSATDEDIICFKDGEGRWLKANQADLNLFHLNGVDYYGKTDAELVPYSPFYKDAFLTCMKTDEACWNKGTLNRGDEIIPKPDGNEVIYDVIKVPVFNPDGSRKMLIVFGREVTKQRIAEKQLVESRLQYKTVIENLHESILVTQKGLIKFFNPSFKKLTGYTDEEIEKLTIVQLIHPEDRPKAIEVDNDSFNMRITPEPYEFRLITKENKSVWVVNRTIKINWNNEGEAVLNFLRDITQEKEAYEKLHKLSVAVEQSEQGFIILDINNKIEYANPYVFNLLEMKESDLIGKSFDVLSLGQINPEQMEEITKDLIEEKTWRGEVKLSKSNGELFWGYLIISPMKNTEGILTNFLIIVIDINELKKIENELRIAKEEAEKSDKLKNIFLMQMSHEIRTPINALLSFSSLLNAELQDSVDEDLRETVKSMERAGNRIIRTIDLLLNMSEIYSGTYEFNPRDIDLDELIQKIVFDYNFLAQEKNLKLIYKNNLENSTIYNRDLHSVNQIIVNLVDNAIKYTDKGSVEILLDKNEKDEIYLQVKDTGIGISKEYLSDLFKPFSQEDAGFTRRYEGNGLGLALIREFVKLNNAVIDVKSEKGKGSTFTVIFK